MIVGLFLRHYKIFNGVKFIPLCKNEDELFTMIIGNNGVGKSSILEALNTFFNDSYWNITKGSKKDEAFIAPVFLIKKDKINLDSKIKRLYERISDYFWNVEDTINANLKADEYKDFFELRNDIKSKYKNDEYYLIMAGITYNDRQKVNFITFQSDIIRSIPELIDSKNNTEKFLASIKKIYSYIYIPIESKVNEILKLENREMQALMDENILKKIEDILNEKKFKNPSTKRGQKSIIDIINSSLNSYIENINHQIGVIDKDYNFKIEGNFKKNLTSIDVRDKILEAYFSIRTLKKDKKEISELSSGEQRLALIDIATAFLKEERKNLRYTILSIDEPESSLHISKCFSQMERITELSKNNQIIVTTHWYGALPVTQKGTLSYLERDIENKKIDIKTYELRNYFEKRGGLPDDILIKSYFELSSTILNSIRAEGTNWIICEGSDDKLYLENYLDGEVENLKIFTIGGCGNVKKLYQYLYIPIIEKSESKEIKGKIFMLVDSDEKMNFMDIPSETKNKKMKISRIQLSKDEKVNLNDLTSASSEYCPSEIEDCLNPIILFEALKNSIEEKGTSEQKEAITYFELDTQKKGSRIKGEDSILKIIEFKGINAKKTIYEFIENYENKYVLANKYIELENKHSSDVVPELFIKIKEFFIES